jgi:hypothetical protein
VGTDKVSRSYLFSKFNNVNELVYAINRDAFYGLLEFTAIPLDGYYPATGLGVDEKHIIFKGGSSEGHIVGNRNPLSDSHTDSLAILPMLKERVEKALFGEDPDDISEARPNSDLGVLNFGTITLCDMYHDDIEEYDENNNPIYANFTDMLGSFCLSIIILCLIKFLN